MMLILVTILLVIACVVFHGFTLQAVAKGLFRNKPFSFYRVGTLIMAAIVVHLIEIFFFGIAYVWMVPSDQHGSIAGVNNPGWRDLYYFSAMTYTATGYGDLVPTGNVRVMATIEALTGLIMIAWTASFAFLVMQRYWLVQKKDIKEL